MLERYNEYFEMNLTIEEIKFTAKVVIAVITGIVLAIIKNEIL